jgi:hypothetical protein
MKQIVSLLCFLLAGCFYIGKDQFEDIVQRRSEAWSTLDCLTIIMSASRSNWDDPRSQGVKVLAIPYYPCVISAIERRAHILGPLQYPAFTYSHTEETYRHDLDTLMAAEAGVYIDWSTGRYLDSRGNYLHDPTQIDSLMFYVSLWNDGRQINSTTDITDLENNIFLLNDGGELLKARHVWGKRHNTLTTEEKLLVVFFLHNNDHHFIANSKNMYLVIKGLQEDIRLKFPVSMMQ